MGVPGRNDAPAAFVRIREAPENYQLEGVAVNLPLTKGRDVHGRQLSLRYGQRGGVGHLAVGFLANALEYNSGSNRGMPLSPGYGKQGTHNLELQGVDGATVGRIVRSLGTLAFNVVVAGAESGPSPITSSTYDLAQAFLKRSVDDCRNNPGSGLLLTGGNGSTHGVAFESEQRDIVVIYPTNTFPSTISIAFVGTGGADDPVLAEVYSIQSRGVSLEMGQLPPGLYDLTEVMRALPMLSMQVPGAEDNPYLDEPTRVALEQRILKLLTERTRQTT